MNTIKIYLTVLMAAIFAISCNPIEDDDLRDKYFDKAKSISEEELTAALEITQPFPNVDGEVKGDQYIVVKNKRLDIGGTWYIKSPNTTQGRSGGAEVTTLICTENGEVEIYYIGSSGGKLVKSKPVKLTVTNVFDPFEILLNGAKDKADITSAKTWEFKPIYEDNVCYMGAHGAWKHGVNPEMAGVAWWNQKKISEVGNQTMVLNYQDRKLTTYDASGNVIAEGTYFYNHDDVGEGVVGQLVTSIPVIGSEYDDATGGQTVGGTNTFWIISIDANTLIIYHPSKYTGSIDWTDSGWWAFYRPKAE